MIYNYNKEEIEFQVTFCRTILKPMKTTCHWHTDLKPSQNLRVARVSIVYSHHIAAWLLQT